MEEIVVKGYAGSLMRALQEKRFADSVVDAISAEDIGKMPAENIAEALQRVPGVSISRERGEGLFITVRGLGPEFNSTLVFPLRRLLVRTGERNYGLQNAHRRYGRGLHWRRHRCQNCATARF